MAECLVDFDNVETLARFQARTRTRQNKQQKIKKTFLFLCGNLSIMLSDTYNKNESVSTKTNTFSGHKLT